MPTDDDHVDNSVGLTERSAGACMAPRSGLYFRPDGHVAACCGGWQVLGRVTGPDRQSLREIWEGPAARELRTALDLSDFGLGCWECGQAAAAGRRSSSLAAVFDRYTTTARADAPRLIDFALSNRCNLQCVMCNGGLSSSIRKHRERRPPLPAVYDDRFFAELDEFLPHLERAQFKGGEPFLAPENRRIWDAFLRLGGSREVSVTTNGTVWNERVERYVGELAMDVILSVDAVDGDVLERIRLGVDSEALWHNVDRFHATTAAAGSSLTLCMCLMSNNWHELRPFLLEVDRRGLHPSVIWVDGPGQFKLLGLPWTQLEEVVRSWEGTSEADLSPAAAAIWQDALDRVRHALDSDAAAVSPVEIGQLTRASRALLESVRAESTGGTTGTLLESVRTELTGGTPGTLLELEFVNGIVESVQVSAWARWLEPEQWVGTGLDQIITVFASAAKTSMRYELESVELGIHRGMITLSTEPEPTRIRAWYVPALEPDGPTHILMGLDSGGAEMGSLAMS